MKLKFERNVLTFDGAACMNEIMEAIDICIDELSRAFQDIMIRQINENGNGSKVMKEEAVKHIKEISRTITGNILELVVGLDEEYANEQAQIRTVVVLFGNQAEGHLHEKPGVETWKKDVNYKSMPDPDTRNENKMLPGLDQLDVSGKIMKNVMQGELTKRIHDFLRNVYQLTQSIDFSIYLK